MRSLLLASVCVLGLIPAAMAEEFVAESELTAATVFVGRAELTRRAEIELPAGAHTIVFKGLSASLMPESLRAEGEGTSRVTFGAVSSRVVAGAELAAERERAIRDDIDKINKQMAAVNSEIRALTAEQDFYLNIGKQATLRTNENIAAIDLKPEQWAQAADVLGTGLRAAGSGLNVQNVAMETLQKILKQKQQELAQVYSGQTSTYEIELPVEVPAATTLTVALSYQVPEATWMPQYDARLDTKTGKLELIQYGAVTQNTGEDWQDIALTLSTAQPSRGTSLPEPQTHWVHLVQSRPGGMAKAARMMAMESASTMAVGDMQAVEFAVAGAAPMEEPMAPAPVAAEFRVAEIDTGGFVNEYKIPGPSTVKADGTESKLMVGPFATESAIHIRMQPQISSDAYLASMMTLKGDAPVLPGTANLFRDGAYVGQMMLPLLRPDQRQPLFFGIDDQFSVRRRVMKDEKSEDGVIARDQILERHYLNDLQNLHSTAFDVIVLETIPVSQNEKIRSEIIKDATTPGYMADPDNIKGLLRWSFKMEPKEKKEVKVGVKVAWPADAQLGGM